MYLSNIKLWNFRKYGTDEEYQKKIDAPDLDLNFTNGLNVLIGSNDSGKTAIIDAIKLLLKTHSYEYIRPQMEDFYVDSTRFRIELEFNHLSHEEAKNFIEWLGYNSLNNIYLRLIYDVSRNSERVLPSEVRAGVTQDGSQLTAEAKEYLKVTYLKPLRDAASELVAKKGSRISQILIGDEAFKGKESTHDLIAHFDEFNSKIEYYFKGVEADGSTPLPDILGKDLKEKIDKYIQSFYDISKESQFLVSESRLKEILEKISIYIEGEKNLGLGTLNRLFMATELIHLSRRGYTGLNLALVEELEAHLHPQAQMQVIDKLQKETDKQLILTTHSPNLASKVKLENLIVCNNNNAYPMGMKYTKLRVTDYTFLERFIDTTKANLFFAKGVILVEGWAEEILIPILAKKLDYDLIQNKVSVVNIANTAFLRYVKIFQRKADNNNMGINVSVVTDLDLRPKKYAEEKNIDIADYELKNIIDAFDINIEKQKKVDKYEDENSPNIKAFISEAWTLEYCIAQSGLLRKIFFKAVLRAHKEQKIDKGINSISDYNNAIKNINSHFSNWEEDIDEIAFKIYWQILGEENYVDTAKDKISKSIIAQYFAQLLEHDKSITPEKLKGEESIKYLIEAIEHVCQ